MRIVAGDFKGRRLKGPPGRAARPTSDKVREALFSILGDVSGAHVLDLFAGTGALALEALSRRAAAAVLVERDRRMVEVARSNAAALMDADDARVDIVHRDALAYLSEAAPDAFDLALIDPPYEQAADLGPSLSSTLARVLAPGGTIVTECDRRKPLELDETLFALRSEHRYGDTLLRIHQADE